MGMMDRDYYKDIHKERKEKEIKRPLKGVFNDNKFSGREYTPTPVPKKKIKVPLSVWDLLLYAVLVFIVIRLFISSIYTNNFPFLTTVTMGLVFCVLTAWLIGFHRLILKPWLIKKAAQNHEHKKGW